jgi:cytochrome P450
LADITTMRMFKLWLHPDFIFNRSSLGKLQEKARSNSAMIFSPIIMDDIRKKNSEKEDEKPKTFIRALMDSRNNFTDSEISDEISSLIIAAENASGMTLSSALLLLAMHKDIQDKLVDELRQVLGTSTDDLYLDIENLNELKYLEMVINEAMRLMPILPLAFRVNDKQFTSSDGYVIPAKANLLINIFQMHRNKAIWGDDADVFKPERFERENKKKIHPYAFIPFTKGPRMCIGWRYAMISMKIQLANILLKYEVDTSLKLDELEFKVNITLNVCQGFMISIKKRENESVV